jgi:hypothetical protein
MKTITVVPGLKKGTWKILVDGLQHGRESKNKALLERDAADMRDEESRLEESRRRQASRRQALQREAAQPAPAMQEWRPAKA